MTRDRGVSFLGLSTISSESLCRAKLRILLRGRPIQKLEIGLGESPAPNKLSRWAGMGAEGSLWTIPEKEIPLSPYLGYHKLDVNTFERYQFISKFECYKIPQLAQFSGQMF